LQALCLVSLLAGLIERRYLLLEGFCHWVLLSAVAVQAHEREEAVWFSVFGLAVGEAGSRPNLLQSAALGSASYRSANVCAAKLPRNFGKTLTGFSQA
jgi:hypothetical protein